MKSITTEYLENKLNNLLERQKNVNGTYTYDGDFLNLETTKKYNEETYKILGEVKIINELLEYMNS